jgi:glutamate synthase domain-containing protein 2
MACNKARSCDVGTCAAAVTTKTLPTKTMILTVDREQTTGYFPF